MFIDSMGTPKIPPSFLNVVEGVEEGLACVKNGGKYGYIDKNGNWMIQPQFESARVFSEGLAAVRIQELEGYIDRSGNIVIQPQFYWTDDFRGDLAEVELQGEQLYVDRQGKIIWRSRGCR
jgi:hypothetical protein